MKIKRRYLLVECAEPVAERDRTRFERVLCEALLSQMGADRYSCANPKIAGFVDERHFVMRANLECYAELVLGLALVRKLNGRKAALFTLRSSGTLRALLKTQKP